MEAAQFVVVSDYARNIMDFDHKIIMCEQQT